MKKITIKNVILATPAECANPHLWLSKKELADYIIIKRELYTLILPRDFKSVSYPMVTAHYDKFGEYEPEWKRPTKSKIKNPVVVKAKRELIINVNNKLGIMYPNNMVLGGDDRAGIYIIFRLIADGIKANYCLFDLEESGAVGSSAFIKAHGDVAKQCSCYLALDRRGFDEVVDYGYSSRQAMAIAESFGYIEDIGSMTDISNIADEFPKPCLNFSVGFTSEHSANEKLHLSAMYFTLDNMRSIIPLTTDIAFSDLEVDDPFCGWDSRHTYMGSPAASRYVEYGERGLGKENFTSDDSDRVYRGDYDSPELWEYKSLEGNSPIDHEIAMIMDCNACPLRKRFNGEDYCIGRSAYIECCQMIGSEPEDTVTYQDTIALRGLIAGESISTAPERETEPALRNELTEISTTLEGYALCQTCSRCRWIDEKPYCIDREKYLFCAAQTGYDPDPVCVKKEITLKDTEIDDINILDQMTELSDEFRSKALCDTDCDMCENIGGIFYCVDRQSYEMCCESSDLNPMPKYIDDKDADEIIANIMPQIN